MTESEPACKKMRLNVRIAQPVQKAWGGQVKPYFSSSCSFTTSKDSSQPTSIRIFTPPSSSSIDCDAADSERAP